MTTFEEKRKDAALRMITEEGQLRRAVEGLVLFGHGRSPGRYRIGEIVTVQPDPEFARTGVTLGSYAVEVIERVDKDTERSLWATACEGVSDSWRWFTVDQALIHLIALRHGQDDHRGDIVTYASRVIGFDDMPEGA
jgi:hypothetical protein